MVQGDGVSGRRGTAREIVVAGGGLPGSESFRQKRSTGLSLTSFAYP